jgi:hypothetical protein
VCYFKMTLYIDHNSHGRGDVIHVRCWCGSHINELLRAHAARLKKNSAKNFHRYCDRVRLSTTQHSKWSNKFLKQLLQTKFQNVSYIARQIVKIDTISKHLKTNNFCFGVKYKFERDSKLKLKSFICTLNRKIIYLTVIFFDKKSIKTNLYSCFHNIIQMKFIFNTFSLTILETLCFKFESQ